jgi:hypothetical protein
MVQAAVDGNDGIKGRGAPPVQLEEQGSLSSVKPVGHQVLSSVEPVGHQVFILLLGGMVEGKDGLNIRSQICDAPLYRR